MADLETSDEDPTDIFEFLAQLGEGCVPTGHRTAYTYSV